MSTSWSSVLHSWKYSLNLPAKFKGRVWLSYGRVSRRKEHRAMLSCLLLRTWEWTLEKIWGEKWHHMAIAMTLHLLKSSGHAIWPSWIWVWSTDLWSSDYGSWAAGLKLDSVRSFTLARQALWWLLLGGINITRIRTKHCKVNVSSVWFSWVIFSEVEVKNATCFLKLSIKGAQGNQWNGFLRTAFFPLIALALSGT